MSLTKFSLAGNNLFIPRLETGKSSTFFYSAGQNDAKTVHVNMPKGATFRDGKKCRIRFGRPEKVATCRSSLGALLGQKPDRYPFSSVIRPIEGPARENIINRREYKLKL
jgi:hypothetical protein